MRIRQVSGLQSHGVVGEGAELLLQRLYKCGDLIDCEVHRATLEERLSHGQYRMVVDLGCILGLLFLAVVIVLWWPGSGC